MLSPVINNIYRPCQYFSEYCYRSLLPASTPQAAIHLDIFLSVLNHTNKAVKHAVQCYSFNNTIYKYTHATKLVACLRKSTNKPKSTVS